MPTNPVWPFTPQPNKPSINEGDYIATYANPVWSMEEGSNTPITPIHNPCGYWTKAYVPPPPPSPPEVSSILYVYIWYGEGGADEYRINSYNTLTGEYIGTFVVPELRDWNNVMAVDKDLNVYCVGSAHNFLRCYNKSGILLYELDIGEANSQWFYSVCVDADGYVYTLESRAEWGEFDQRIVKRNPGDPAIIETKQPWLYGGQGLIMDSNKYVYVGGCIANMDIVKYDYEGADPMPIVAQSTTIESYQRTLAFLDGYLAIGNRGDSRIKTAKSDLSAYINENFIIPNMDGPLIHGYPWGISNVGTDFLACGYSAGLVNAIVGRYSSIDGSAIWETIIGSGDDISPYQVAAFPFESIT